MRIAVGGDHAGLELKNTIAGWLKAMGHEVLDIGAHSFDAQDDYPDFAAAVAEAVATKKAERGIIGCGSGVGACIVANKVPGVRAGVCHDTYSAHQGVEHDDMNVICVGGRIIGIEPAREIVTAFVNAKFVSTEEKYVRRLNKLNVVEAAGTHQPEQMHVVTALFEVKPDQRAAFLAAAREGSKTTKASEPGCIRFDVVEDKQNPNKIGFYEVYRNAEAFQAHTRASHTKEWVEKTKPMVLKWDAAYGSNIAVPKYS